MSEEKRKDLYSILRDWIVSRQIKVSHYEIKELVEKILNLSADITLQYTQLLTPREDEVFGEAGTDRVRTRIWLAALEQEVIPLELPQVTRDLRNDGGFWGPMVEIRGKMLGRRSDGRASQEEDQAPGGVPGQAPGESPVVE